MFHKCRSIAWKHGGGCCSGALYNFFTAAANAGVVKAGAARTQIFIHPPHPFQVVNSLVTNFHLPCSTLLMLVSAFAAPGEMGGRDLILGAYAEAIRERYRFFSYGDAMLIE